MNKGLMTYKGYSALIEYSEEDECLVGRVLGINDSVSFHGDSIAELRRELKLSVDAYLEACKKFNKNPDRPYSGRMNLRLPPETHKLLALEAEQKGKSINDLILMAVEVVYRDNTNTATITKPTRQRKVNKR